MTDRAVLRPGSQAVTPAVADRLRRARRARFVARDAELERGALGDDRMVLIGARPGVPRTLALFAQERERWLLTLGGHARRHPPRDRAGFLAFAASVAPAAVADAARRVLHSRAGAER